VGMGVGIGIGSGSGLVGIVVAAGGLRVAVGLPVGLVVGTIVGLGGWFVGARLFAETFPIASIDGVCQFLGVFESSRFDLLTHNVFDAFGQTRIVTMTEYSAVPTGANSESIEFNIVFDDPLIFAHLQIVDRVFGVASRINRTEV